MKAIKDLINARNKLPQEVNAAAAKLQEKTGMEYFDALEVLDMAMPTMPVRKATAALDPEKKRVTKRKASGALTKAAKRNVKKCRPENLKDIAKRLDLAEGSKRKVYKVCYELFKKKGSWVTGAELRKLGADPTATQNKYRVRACLPRGYVIRIKRGLGYKVCTVNEAMQD